MDLIEHKWKESWVEEVQETETLVNRLTKRVVAPKGEAIVRYASDSVSILGSTRARVHEVS